MFNLRENNMSDGYNATLENGSEIYIPNWPVDVAIENLTSVSKYFGSQNVIIISEINVPAVISAIMNAENPKKVTELIKHFICQVRIDGNKIATETIDEMFTGKLVVVAELFTHVIHSQYFDFFDLGLVKEPSPSK